MNQMQLNRKVKPNLWEEFILKLRRLTHTEKILCDSCRYDWRGACHRPERPNAVWCPDYKKRG